MFLLAAPLLAQDRAYTDGDEIVIEMHGEPDSDRSAQPTLWSQNARQLTRQLKGKTREQVLYAMPVVSDKDRIIRSANTEYALVEYYSGGNFRKFLFKAETPQLFLSAAATAADVLAINKKYGVNIGLTQGDFESFYKEKAQKEAENILPAGFVLYKLAYTDVNTPAPKTRWFLFEKLTLTQTFETAQEKETYLAGVKAQAAEKPQTALSAARKAARPAVVRKGLISGGTAQDQADLPRVILNKPLLPTPTLTKNSQNATL